MESKSAKRLGSAGKSNVAKRTSPLLRPLPLLTVACVLSIGLAWHRHVNEAASTNRRSAHRLPPVSDLNPAADSTHATEQSSLSDSSATQSAVLDQPTEPSIASAQSMIDRGRVNEGAAILEKLLEKEPTNTQALMEMAMVYTLDLKEPHKSRRILESILDLNPEHRAALNELELLYKELDAVEDGLIFLEQKAQQHPESLEIQYTYGRLVASSNPAAAIPWLQRATLIADQKEQALDQLATAALKSGNFSLAVKSWSEALQLAEQELETAKASGESGLDYLEDRIAATKLELAKAKEQLGGSRRQIVH